jgi:small-conductance mechanosensitive channel
MLVNDYQTAARQKVFVALAISVFSAAFFAWCARVAPNEMVRIGDLMMLAWTPVTAWIVWRRKPARVPGAAASTMDLIDFHRAQVAREMPDLRLIAAILIPLFAAMAVILTGIWPKAPRMSLQLLPPVILLAVWVAFYVRQLRRQRRRVADRLREIDALRGL